MKHLLASVWLATLASLAAAAPTVEMKTSMGELTIELNPDKAPRTVENFLQYVKDGFYAGTIFHRVIDGFMIQGGGFDKAMNQKPTRAPVANEAANGLKNTTGSIAMARTQDPHSATAQFYINVADNGPLDYPSRDGWGYCVFGKVTKGMDVVQAIARLRKTRVGPHGDVPVTPVVIESVRLINP